MYSYWYKVPYKISLPDGNHSTFNFGKKMVPWAQALHGC